MISLSNASWRAAVLARWVARVAGTLLFLFFVAFVAGEGPPPLAALSPHERAYWAGLIALFGGLALACVWESWGASLTLAAWLFLWMLAGRAPTAALFLLPAAIALLHGICWLRLRFPAPALGPPPPAARLASRIAWVLVAAFALLCANEMFGNPPLMTPPLHPSAALAGHWHTAPGSILSAELEIHPDGAVTGTFADVPLDRARIANNRTWFGRLMHWRSEYTLAGQNLSAGLNLRAGLLEGAVLRSHGPLRFTLARQLPHRP